MNTDQAFTETVTAAGTATIKIQPTGRQTWTVTQVTPEATASGSATGSLRKNGVLVSPFLASGDVIADAPPVMLRPGDVMTVEWTGLTAGDLVHALVIYDDGN